MVTAMIMRPAFAFIDPIQSNNQASNAVFSSGSRSSEPALFQTRERLAHHAITEMALRNAEQFRAAPFLLNGVDVGRARDQIEIAGDKEHPRRIAQRIVV